MKWIVILLLVAAGVWAYLNVDFSNLGSQTNDTIKQEKTLKKFFNADEQNKQQTKEVLDTF